LGTPGLDDNDDDDDNTNYLTPWLYSASELYRLSDRRLSAKLVPTFADRGLSHGQRGGSPTAVISVFETGDDDDNTLKLITM
jgi:hypothetical protein